MNLQFVPRSVRDVIATVFALALLAGLASLPFVFRTQAALPPVEAGLQNYDIRIDKAAKPVLDSYRQTAGRSESSVVEFREQFSRAENDLRRNVPTLTTVYNDDLRIPEVIATDVRQGKAFLSRPSSQKRSEILKTFLRDNAELIGARTSQIDELKVAADYTNPDGNLSFVELNQEINGIPVFRGEVKAGFTKAGEIIRVINNLAHGIDATSISTDFGDPSLAVTAAARHIRIDPATLDLASRRTDTELKSTFGSGDSATTAEKMYFPTEPGVVVTSWRVLIWQPQNAYYIVVDNQGTMLWRKDLTDHQTQPATYNVYANPNAMVNIAHNPFPFSPAPPSPSGQQGTAISRTNVTRIGNEAPYTFNQLGWIPDGVFITDGNNIQAGLDRDGNVIGGDGVDPNSEAFSNTRLFSYAYQPFNPNTNTGDAPIPSGTQTYPGTQYQQGVVTQLFYTSNWFHDEMYRLGFTEGARNFQHVNFTGQGVGDDRVRGEAQDAIGSNNANFTTAADGNRGRMQMFVFTGPNPDIDGSLDTNVVIHENMHGVSNRLHGNALGLFNDMSRGMGEGWSDFYGMAMLSSPTDPIPSLATNGAYNAYLFQGNQNEINNTYYGIRRFPTAVKTSLGGPNSLPHNPLTFADIDITQLNISDGAFPAREVSGNSDAVHNAGEIWCVALWEVRARFIQRLGWEVGNRRILQLVTDGMKLAPVSPTPITERDAIVAAAYATGNAADVADIWAGFSIRGLGANASIQHVGGTSIGGTGTARVTEGFGPPNLFQTPAVTVSDVIGDNDGFPEPGETVNLDIPLTNSTGTTATNVTLEVVGGSGFNPIYGTMTGASTRTLGVSYTIPPGAPCGGTIQLTFNVNSSLGPVSFTRSFFVGKPVGGTTTLENFDGVTAPALPTGWSATTTLGGINFVNSTLAPDSVPNAMYALNPSTVGGGSDLSPPPISVNSANATMTFRHSFNTEDRWDGGVIDMSVAGGEWLDFKAAGGIFLQNSYNGINSAGNNNPVANRESWTGRSTPPTADYITTIAQFPAAANGKIVQLRFRFGSDNNTAGTLPNPGWFIDNVSLSGAGFVTSFACAGDSGFEGDVASRPSGDGSVSSTDVVQVRRFVVSLDTANPAPNEFQRADCSPRSTFGNSVLDAADVVQVRRYAAGLDPLTPSAGPIVPPPFDKLRAAIGGGFMSDDAMGRALRLTSQSLSPGESVTFAVTVDQGEEKIAAVAFTLVYDPSKLTSPVVRLSSKAGSRVALTVNDTKPGFLTILADSVEGITLAELVTVTFKLAPDASPGRAPISFDQRSISVASPLAEAIRVFGVETNVPFMQFGKAAGRPIPRKHIPWAG